MFTVHTVLSQFQAILIMKPCLMKKTNHLKNEVQDVAVPVVLRVLFVPSITVISDTSDGHHEHRDRHHRGADSTFHPQRH